jgi:asparagine synthase (glutamine-hydrolysing)
MCGIFSVINKSDSSDIIIHKNYEKIQSRGPDKHILTELDSKVTFGFHRLSIMDVSDLGNQPFTYKDSTHNLALICNGEIYNYKKLAAINNFNLVSGSDCEVILHLYKTFGIETTVNLLDGVFSFIIYDINKQHIIASRDIIGVRPLFYGFNEGQIYFCSEMKALHSLCKTINIFTPGTFMTINLDSLDLTSKFYYQKIYPKFANLLVHSDENIYYNIRKYLTKAVSKRLMSDRPIGCLLSGGLDSSLITSIAVQNYNSSLETFSIGISGSVSPDLKAAKEVVDFLGIKKHHQVTYTIEEGINAINDVIYSLESFDVTTIRASVPQYLLAKYIKENTDIRVILSGEGADEFCGYQYLKNAPSDEEFLSETTKMLELLHQYDVLRTDRSTAAWGLEVRVPFLDKKFIDYIMSIDCKYKRCSDDKIEKHVIRSAFNNGKYLPDSILWRPKNAFSDAVGYSWVDKIKEHVDKTISESEYLENIKKYTHCQPYDKESYFYRKIFEKHYPQRSHLISSFWRPNQDWFSEKVSDPSARILKCFKD